jgi:hypothetical protein
MPQITVSMATNSPEAGAALAREPSEEALDGV